METWDCNTQKRIKTPDKQIKFLKEIEKICKKHNLSISHEDSSGAFIIEKYNQDNIEWLKHGHIGWL